MSKEKGYTQSSPLDVEELKESKTPEEALNEFFEEKIKERKRFVDDVCAHVALLREDPEFREEFFEKNLKENKNG